MKSREFFGKFADKYLWGNILAMAVVVAALYAGVKYGLVMYTHHGEEIPVPDVRGMDFSKARALLESNGLRVEVGDTGYNKRMPADCVLLQNPGYGARVKSGHMVYVTVNSVSSPTLAIPDLADNSSVREAEAKLAAMGFRLLDPKPVTGEKDWVYGIMAGGKRLAAGDRVPIDVPLTLMVGSGVYDDDAMVVDYVDPEYADTGDDTDDFEEVTEPPLSDDTAGPGGGLQNTNGDTNE